MTSSPVRLLLLDDHALMREGLRALLTQEDDLEVVAEASGLDEALAAGADPDVIVADLVLPDARGAEVVAGLHARYPDAQILVLTMVDNPADVHLTFAAGARGYLLKEAASTELAAAIRKVADGQDYLQPAMGAAMAAMRPVLEVAHASADAGLSGREIEVQADRPRSHERRDRVHPARLAAHGRAPPGEHPPQAGRPNPSRARALRERDGRARVGLICGQPATRGTGHCRHQIEAVACRWYEGGHRGRHPVGCRPRRARPGGPWTSSVASSPALAPTGAGMGSRRWSSCSVRAGTGIVPRAIRSSSCSTPTSRSWGGSRSFAGSARAMRPTAYGWRYSTEGRSRTRPHLGADRVLAKPLAAPVDEPARTSESRKREEELERAVARLRDTEERYRTLVERLPVVAYSEDLEFDNPATEYVAPGIERLLGFTVAEWIGGPNLWRTLLHPDDRDRVLGEWARLATRERAAFTMEYRIFRKDGSLVWLLDDAVVLEWRGRPHIEGMLQDITRAEGIGGSARAAGAGAHAGERAADRAGRAEDELRHHGLARAPDAADRGHRLHGDPRRAVERSRRGRTPRVRADGGAAGAPPAPSRRGPPRALATGCGRPPDAAHRHGVGPPGRSGRCGLREARHRPGGRRGERATVEADPDRVVQILGALIANATKYGASPVRVEAEPDGTSILIRVIDRGPGVPADLRGRLFERFARSEQQKDSVQPGFGLGLATARELARAMQGDVWYERVPRRATTFCLRLRRRRRSGPGRRPPRCRASVPPAAPRNLPVCG